MPSFSNSSKSQLASCDPKLQNIFNLLITVFDHSIITGHRGKEAQDKAIAQGASKTPWPNSKHNQKPSLATDVMPFPIKWRNKADLLKQLKSQSPEVLELLNDILVLYHFAGMVKGVGLAQGTEIRWGGDWDGDFDFRDQTFDDVPHYEVKQK
jgi:peptidoglycan L-alanyl-D-glutamate endopeptidase CwlK